MLENIQSERVPTVLVVDDDPINLALVRRFLRGELYQVLTLDSAADALLVLRSEPIDLVLLDIVLPDLSGFEVCHQVKDNPDTRMIPVVLMTGMSDRESRLRGFEVGADDYLFKPVDAQVLKARSRSLIRRKLLDEEMNRAEGVLFAIAQALESRDLGLSEHCGRLDKLVEGFGRFLALPESDLHALRQGAYLHDIGKVGIPDRILFKDGPLSEDEWSVMRRHVLIGEQICSPMRSLRGVLPIVRYHHERWDGSGYCEGLIGDDIPYLARVFQICDCWDALTSVRPYKQALTPAEAIQVLWGEVAKGWRDPELVKRFEAFAGVPVACCV